MPSIISKLHSPLPAPRWRRGGWIQQCHVAAASSAVVGTAAARTHSVTANRLIWDWASGTLSAARLWFLVEGLIADGLKLPAIERLYRIAKHDQDGNANGNLIKLFEDCGITHFIDQAGNGIGSVSHLIKPSSIIRMLARQDLAKFEQCMGAVEDNLVSFWHGYFSSGEGREYCAVHCKLSGYSADSLSRTIPLLLHQDAGPFSKTKSCMILDWKPLQGGGIFSDNIYPVFSYLKEVGGSGESDAAWDFFVLRISISSSLVWMRAAIQLL